MRVKTLAFLSALLLLGCVLQTQAAVISTGIVAGVYVKDFTTLIVDDWNDGVKPNNIGGGSGAFNSAGAKAGEIIVSTVALGGTGCSCEISYDVATADTYSGFWMEFTAGSTRNLSYYKSLSFYVKGAAGGEFFKVELSTGAGGWKSRLYVNDYLESGAVTTDWQKVTIPLADFPNITDWTEIYQFTIVFEHRQAVLNGSPLSGKIYIDNLVMGSEFCPVVRLDYFNDNLRYTPAWGEYETNSTGGLNEFVTGNSAVLTHVYVSTESVSAARSMELKYNVSDADNRYAGFKGYIGGGGVFGGQYAHDYSVYDTISFSAKAGSSGENPENILVTLRYGPSWSASSVLVPGITTSWQKFQVPFASFGGLDQAALSQYEFWIYNTSATNKSGRVYIDNVQIELGAYVADSSSPTVPSSIKVMDTAAGRALSNGSEVSWVNWITAQADSNNEDSTLESVRFEYRKTGDPEWTLINNDYEVSDNTYSTYWDTVELSENETYEFRVVAQDTSGNQSVSSVVTGITVKHFPDMAALTDAQVIDLMQKQIFWYYWSEINPSKLFAKDRANNFASDNYGYTSISATGYELVAACVAYERGWIGFTDAYNRVVNILKNYFNAPDSGNSADPFLVQHKGFFYHYTNFGGGRSGSSEVSTIDTSLFTACAMYAGRYFQNIGYTVPWNFAEQIYRRIDWKWMTDNDPNGFLHWGWTPENGFNQGKIDAFNEGILAYIMAFGSPEASKKLTDTSVWNSLIRETRNYGGLRYTFQGSLFTHQYPSLFLDFSGMKDGHACYATNLFNATLHHHRYAYLNRQAFFTYGRYSWGLGATDMPGSGYYSYGIEYTEDGTIALNNMLTAITERPRQVLGSIRYLYGTFGEKLWGKYTFCDSYNTDYTIVENFNETGMWRDKDVLGVQQGAVFTAMENYRSGSVKELFTGISFVQNGLGVLGFVSDTVAPGKITDLCVSKDGAKVVLIWTSPGDNNYSNLISSGTYEVRFSTDPGDTWDNAPDNYLQYDIIWTTDTPAGVPQVMEILGLMGDATYYFRISAADGCFNWNLASDATTVYMPPDVTAPAAVTDLVPAPSGGTVKLSWTAPGDDGDEGEIRNGYYNVRYSTMPGDSASTAPYSIVWSTDVASGNFEAKTITALMPMTSHYFWIRASDEFGCNWGGFSNKTTFYVIDPVAPAQITCLIVTTDFQMKLTWIAPGDDGRAGTAARYIVKYSTVSNIDRELLWAGASVFEQGWIPSAAGSFETKTLTTLDPRYYYWFSIRVADDMDNISPLSNADNNSALAGYFLARQSLGGSTYAFGDIDNDGDIDLALGRSVYKNNGGVYSHFFTCPEPVFGWEWQGIGGGQVKWFDYDKDGYLDLLLCPLTQRTKIYRNNNGGGFAGVQTLTQTENSDSGLDAGDYDNDGDMDVAVTGWGASTAQTHIWQNNNSVLTNMGSCGLPSRQLSNIEWGDYDNDGWNDVAVRGRVFRNNRNGSFSDSGYGCEAENASIAWGDYDNDGNLDLAISGYFGPTELYRGQIYHNNGDGTMTLLLSDQTLAEKYMAAWGDYDNDGDLDILLGNKLFNNMGGGIFYTRQTLQNGRRAAWADINGDGSLDFIANGILYLNTAANYGIQNSTPLPPSALSAGVYASSIAFTWSDGYDAETSKDGLYYSIRVGTGQYTGIGDANIIPEGFHSPLLGNYVRPKLSNTQLGRWLTSDLREGTSYYWSVQSIDSGLRRSSWSAEQITYNSNIVLPDQITDLAAVDTHSGDIVCLTWTATGDDGAAGNIANGAYWIRYSSSISAAWDDMTNEIYIPSNVVAKSTQAILIEGLQSGASYYFYLKLRDEGPANWSDVSNQAFCPSLTLDIIAPSNITTLSATQLSMPEGQVSLSWIHTGDDGLAGALDPGSKFAVEYSQEYAISWSTNDVQVIIDASGVNPGAALNTAITELANGATYYFKLWVRDDLGNWSGLSNTATAWAQIDSITPAVITTLTALAGANYGGEVTLQWIAPGDNNWQGTIESYEITYGTNPLYFCDFDDGAGHGWSTNWGISLNGSMPHSSPYAWYGRAAASGWPYGGEWETSSKTLKGPMLLSLWWYHSHSNAGIDLDGGAAFADTGNYGVWERKLVNVPPGVHTITMKNYCRTGVSQLDDLVAISTLTWAQSRAPGGPGGYLETEVVKGLPAGSTCYFVIYARDEAGHKTRVSNTVSMLSSADTNAPSDITDFYAVSPARGVIVSTWTAPGNDGDTGGIVNGRYWIKYSSNSADIWASMPNQSIWAATTFPGNNDSRGLNGLVSDATYYMYIKARDIDGGNWSGLSNKVTCLVTNIDSESPGKITDFSASRDFQAKLVWTAPGDNGYAYDLIGGTWRVKYSSAPDSTPDTAEYTIDKSKAYISQGFVYTDIITGLQPESTYYFWVAIKDQSNNWSVWSDTASAVPGSFYSYWRSTETENTQAAAWGDYDNDGDLDQLVGNYGQVNRVYRNNGGGAFISVWTSVGQTDNTRSVAWGDFDNDGDLDQLVGNYGQVNRVYRNNGDGTFTLTWSSVETENTRSVAWGDFDNDGDLDQLVGNYGQVNWVYRNNGNCTFTSVWSSIGQTENTCAAVWGDYDCDGDLDQLIGNEDQVNRVYRNDSGGAFTPVWASVETAKTNAVSLGDYDNDGYPDLLVGNYGQLNRVYKNNGDGSFAAVWESAETENTSAVAWGDYDNDGDLDQLIGNYNQVNRLYRSLEADFGKINEAPSVPADLTVALIQATTYPLQLRWSRSTDNGTGAAPEKGIYYEVIVATESSVDNTGKWIVSPSTGSGASPFMGNYAHGYCVASSTQPGLNIAPIIDDATYYFRVRAVDPGYKFSAWSLESSTFVPLIAPGKITSVTAQAGLQASLYWTAPGDNEYFGNVSNGKFRISYSSYPASTPDTAAYSLEKSSSWLLGASFGQIITGLKPDTTYYFWVRMRDGKEDNWSLWSDTANCVSGKWILFSEPAGATGMGSGAVSWGDFDNDGDLDLAVNGHDGTTNRFRVYRNDNGTFNLHSEPAGATGPGAGGSMAWGDFENDGDLDLAVNGYDGTGYRFRVYRNDNGAFSLHSEPAGATGPGNGAVSWGDFDNDGDLDLAVNGYDGVGYRFRVYRNDNGAFNLHSEPAGITGPGGDGSVVWGDFDNDGDLDLAVIGYDFSQTRFRVYRNDNGVFNLHSQPAGVSGPGRYGCVAWGDVDNDGDLDLAVNGQDNGGGYRFRVYRNDNGAFNLHSEPAGATGPGQGSVGWGDFDNDGDLDLAVNGYEGTGNRFRIYKSFWAEFNNQNTAPAAPSGLAASLVPSTTFPLQLRWDRATDAETSANDYKGLNYDVRVATEPITDGLAKWIVSPSSGAGKTPLIGNYPHGYCIAASNQPGLNLAPELEDATYYWQVRTIDSGFAVSGWSVESSTYVPLIAPSAVVNLAASPGTGTDNIKLTWTAPGDDWSYNSITDGEFDVKYSSDPAHAWGDMTYGLSWSTSTTPSTGQTVTVGGLEAGTTYYFYIKTRDENDGNWSELSNKTTAATILP